MSRIQKGRQIFLILFVTFIVPSCTTYGPRPAEAFNLARKTPNCLNFACLFNKNMLCMCENISTLALEYFKKKLPRPFATCGDKKFKCGGRQLLRNVLFMINVRYNLPPLWRKIIIWLNTADLEDCYVNPLHTMYCFSQIRRLDGKTN